MLFLVSDQITFRLGSLNWSRFRFDNRFGPSEHKFMVDEENLFFYEFIEKSLKLYNCPIVIANHLKKTNYKIADGMKNIYSK